MARSSTASTWIDRTTVPLLLSLAWRNSASKRERSLLSILAIALGVGLTFGTQLINLSLQRQLSRATSEIIGNADAEVFAFSDQGFSQDMVDLIAKLPEVRFSPRLSPTRPMASSPATTQPFRIFATPPVPKGVLIH